MLFPPHPDYVVDCTLVEKVQWISLKVRYSLFCTLNIQYLNNDTGKQQNVLAQNTVGTGDQARLLTIVTQQQQLDQLESVRNYSNVFIIT